MMKMVWLGDAALGEHPKSSRVGQGEEARAGVTTKIQLGASGGGPQPAPSGGVSNRFEVFLRRDDLAGWRSLQP